MGEPISFGTIRRAKATGLRQGVLLERISAREVLVRRFRLGGTEHTALTWLLALVEALRQAYPKVQIEPLMELSSE